MRERVVAPPKAARFYLPELDVLRFFAFFAIFFHHLVKIGGGNPGLLDVPGRAGSFGVDLFFTLSGYLITSLLLRERNDTGDINLRAFYMRRTLRIWPLYYFSIALAFLLTQLPTWIASAPPYLSDVFPPMKASSYFFMAVFLFNFNFYGSLLYNPIPLMTQLWSLSVEEQFYAVWPWFARYLPRRRIVVVPLVMIAVAFSVRAWVPFDSVGRLVWNYTFARLDPIAIGILIALLPAFNPGPTLRLVLVLVGVACWGFASAYCGLPDDLGALKISMGFPAVAFGSGAFVLAAIGAQSLRRNYAMVRLTVYLGKISYGLYVYNTMAFTIAALFLYRVMTVVLPESGRMWTMPLSFALLAFGLNVVMAAASYRWLEAPFLWLKERFARVPSRSV